MNRSDNTNQSVSLDLTRRKRMIAVVGAILSILLVVQLASQLALRLGWKTYGGMDGVSAIAVDGKGQIWAVGYSQGRESLMTYTENGTQVEAHLPAELTQAHPITVMVDAQDRVWVGTDFGVIGLRNGDGTWILFPPEKYGSDSTRQIIMDGQGRVWARSHRGPAFLDPGAGDRSIRYANSGMMNSDAVALATDPQGQLWALTTQREVNLLERDGNWRTVFVVPGTVRNGFMDASLAFDPQGQLWLATVQGVGVLSPNGSWTEHPLGDPYRPLTLNDVIVDVEGRVWVAAFQPRGMNAKPFSGLFLFNPQTGWTSYSRSNSGLVINADALALDPRGQVWIGSAQGQLSRFDSDSALLAAGTEAIRRAAMVIVPGILLSVTLLAILVTKSFRRGMGSQKEFISFSLGFAGWFTIAVLIWGLLRYSQTQSSSPLFINPLSLLVPVVHILLMILLYVRLRQMARGAFSAMIVNSIALLLMSPASVGSLGSSVFGAIFMMPFFLLG